MADRTTPVTMTFSDPLLQELYDQGEISGSFTDIGLKATGDTNISNSTVATP